MSKFDNEPQNSNFSLTDLNNQLNHFYTTFKNPNARKDRLAYRPFENLLNKIKENIGRLSNEDKQSIIGILIYYEQLFRTDCDLPDAVLQKMEKIKEYLK
jgi:ribosomal protein L33